MGVKKILISLVAISFVAACGGGGSGGGGLPVSRVEIIYKLINEGMQAGLMPALQAMLGKMAGPVGGCEFGGSVVSLEGLTGTCSDRGTETSGTWALSGTMTCKHEPVTGGTLFTVTAMDAALTLTNCVSTPNVDTNGDGISEATNVILTGPIDPFAFGVNTTILAIGSGTDITSVTLNGTAGLTFTNFQLGGDVTATATFVQDLTFDQMVITAEGEPTCDPNTFSATEGGQSGTCTIAATCGSCT